MNIIECTQGSADWRAIRSQYFTASEAPAMLGLSKYKTRSALLREKATGVSEEVDSFKQAAFDRGHEAESIARPLVEAFLQEDLFPCTGTQEVEGLPLLASFDGLTMGEDVDWENKLHNDSLAAMVATGELDGTYWPQLEHQLLVSGASRALFTLCDGEKITAQLWYESKPERRAQLIAGWKQFAEDLKTYTPPEVIPAAIATPQMQLPAVSVQVNGGVAVVDNLAVFGDALRAYVERINKEPETDLDFANLEETVKTLKKAEDALEAAKASALGQVASIDTLKRTADQLQELARANRLTIEKLVKAEKENRRNAIVRDAQMFVGAHIANLNARLGKPYMPTIAADFQGAVKGLKTITSIQNACDTELARVKIEANEVADRIEINLVWLRENAKDYVFLFSDTATIVLKQKDDFESLAKLRIAEHKEAEAKRIEAETQRIRAEEEAKATAKVKAEQEEAARIAAQQTVAPAFGVNATIDPAAEAEKNARAKTALDSMSTATVTEYQPVTPVVHEVQTDTGRTIKLGEISAAIGFTVTAEFLGLIGFHATIERNAKLYREADFPRICSAIARHVEAVALTFKQAA